MGSTVPLRAQAVMRKRIESEITQKQVQPKQVSFHIPPRVSEGRGWTVPGSPPTGDQELLAFTSAR